MDRALAGLFALTLFVAASLLFSVQPMIARMILPALGGAPAVWTGCMLFFQTALLAGYAYAHLITRHLRMRSQLVLHLGLIALALASLPLTIPIEAMDSLATRSEPTVGLLRVLGRSAGCPFFVLAATAPLLQRWYSRLELRSSTDPYFLYAASNAGSLFALLAYPLWIESRLGLAGQAIAWSRGTSCCLALVGACGLAAVVRSARAPSAPAETESVHPAISTKTWLGWVVLAFIPSSLLLGVTSAVTTDLAAAPLLWVVPLALYLMSFIIVFARRRWVPERVWDRLLLMLMIPQTVVIGVGLVQPWWVPLHWLAFFCAAMVCHGALARSRPEAPGLTSFYLALSFGGALGGLFNAMVAPLVFDRVAEYPLMLVAACLVAASRLGTMCMQNRRVLVKELAQPAIIGGLVGILCVDAWGIAESWVGVVATIVASGLAILVVANLGRRPVQFSLTIGALLLASGLATGISGRVIHQERSFFGVLEVTEVPEGNFHRLFHGSTLHGQQAMDTDRRREPLTYFTRGGPIGQVFEVLRASEGVKNARVAVTGVGAGSLASYAREGEAWTFYEIDPAVVRVARDTRYFTYLSDCRASSLAIRLGDARLALALEPDHEFDLMILDAFSSDAIPAHLLTRESLALYKRKLDPEGMLVFNISNRYLDLEPVVGLLARDAGLVCRLRVDAAVSLEEKAAGKQGSIWAVMTARETTLGALASDPRWETPRLVMGDSLWTDDSSSLLDHLSLFGMSRRRAGATE